MENLRFKVGPKSFYQTNTDQAYELYKVARDFAGLTGTELVYDLYTGTGTIANFVAGKARKVIGIEYVPEAIEDAKINSQINGIGNTLFFAGDMKDILNKEFIATHGQPDVIITDPPRAGMHKDVIETILFAAPHRIVYVSCNPATQARDLALLDSQYKIMGVAPWTCSRIRSTWKTWSCWKEEHKHRKCRKGFKLQPSGIFYLSRFELIPKKNFSTTAATPSSPIRESDIVGDSFTTSCALAMATPQTCKLNHGQVVESVAHSHHFSGFIPNSSNRTAGFRALSIPIGHQFQEKRFERNTSILPSKSCFIFCSSTDKGSGSPTIRHFGTGKSNTSRKFGTVMLGILFRKASCCTYGFPASSDTMYSSL